MSKIKANFKEWREKLKKENPEKLRKIKNDAQKRWRAKKKAEKKLKESEEIEAQFKAGNLNFGVKMHRPKAMSWEEFKKANPTTDFFAYIEYKDSLRCPEIEKLELEKAKEDEYRREKAEKIYQMVEGHDLPDKVNLGFNFFHPEQQKTDLDVSTEKENRMKAVIKDFYEKLKR